jgi:cell cycle arrest protein BUB3
VLHVRLTRPRRHDFTSGATTALGSHSNGVRALEAYGARGAVLSGSWDKTVKLWDPRAGDAAAGAGGGAVASLALPERAFSMSLAGATSDTLVVACAARRLAIFDLRKTSSASGSGGGGSAASGEGALVQSRESTLRHQLRALRCFPDGRGFAVSSIEGRVAVEFIDPAAASEN